MARQVDMVKQNQGDREEHGSNKADDGGEENQLTRLVQQDRDRRYPREEQKKKEVPGTGVEKVGVSSVESTKEYRAGFEARTCLPVSVSHVRRGWCRFRVDSVGASHPEL